MISPSPLRASTAERLLRHAEDTAESAGNSSILKRRAVSTAYYAVFHAIAKICAREFLPKARMDSFEFERVYRALEHGSLKTEFNKTPLKENPAIREIGVLVAALQSERHKSDYLPPRALYGANECKDHIQSARLALTKLGKLNAPDRRILAVSLLFKNRSQ
jgi:uncharacterized protein (UPF0332 family)